MKNLRTGIVAAILFAFAVHTYRQHQQIARLLAEQIVIGDRIAQAASWESALQQTARQLRSTIERLEEDQIELMRFRAQSSKLLQLEEENAALKIEARHIATQLAQARKQETPPPAPTKEQRESVINGTIKGTPTPSGGMDFGEVEFSDESKMILDFGDGAGCVASATMLADGQIEMTFTFESEIDGIPIQTEQTWTQLPGNQLSGDIGGFEISLTPKFKAQ